MTGRFYMVGGTHGVTPAVYPESNTAAVEHGRLVAVVDPEDTDAVDRLVHLFWDHGNDDCDDPAAMREALREFAAPAPPRPDEPTGLGAVVEDEVGDLWLRDGMPGDRSQSGHWWNKTVAHEKNYDGVLRAEWPDIAVVRVLSDGVTP